MSYIRSKSASFSSAYSGLATVGYRLYNLDGTANGPRITSNVQELIANSGVYISTVGITFPDDFEGYLSWDIGTTPNVFDVYPINPSDSEGVVLASDGLDNVIVENAGSDDINARQALQACLASIMGILSGVSAGTSPMTLIFKDPSGTTTRATVTVDGLGNRTEIELNLTP